MIIKKKGFLQKHDHYHGRFLHYYMIDDKLYGIKDINNASIGNKLGFQEVLERPLEISFTFDEDTSEILSVIWPLDFREGYRVRACKTNEYLKLGQGDEQKKGILGFPCSRCGKHSYMTLMAFVSDMENSGCAPSMRCSVCDVETEIPMESVFEFCRVGL